MYLKEQEYVCALAETGNMTSAAARLFISQPALSAYIRAVEDRLGTPLFVRKKGRYALTQLGVRYVETARRMLELKDVFNLELSLQNSGRGGCVRLGLQTRRSPMVIAGIVRFFATRYPQISLSVEEGNLEKLGRMLRDNAIDIMLCSIDDRESGVGYRSLGFDTLLLAVHEDSPLLSMAAPARAGCYPAIALSALHDQLFFLPRPEQSLRRTCEALFGALSFTPRSVMEIRSIEASLRLVSEGWGVAFNRSSYAVAMDIPHIRYLSVEGDRSISEVVLAYAPEYERVAAIRELLDGLASTLQL